MPKHRARRRLEEEARATTSNRAMTTAVSCLLTRGVMMMTRTTTTTHVKRWPTLQEIVSLATNCSGSGPPSFRPTVLTLGVPASSHYLLAIESVQSPYVSSLDIQTRRPDPELVRKAPDVALPPSRRPPSSFSVFANQNNATSDITASENPLSHDNQRQTASFTDGRNGASKRNQNGHSTTRQNPAPTSAPDQASSMDAGWGAGWDDAPRVGSGLASAAASGPAPVNVAAWLNETNKSLPVSVAASLPEGRITIASSPPKEEHSSSGWGRRSPEQAAEPAQLQTDASVTPASPAQVDGPGSDKPAAKSVSRAPASSVSRETEPVIQVRSASQEGVSADVIATQDAARDSPQAGDVAGSRRDKEIESAPETNPQDDRARTLEAPASTASDRPWVPVITSPSMKNTWTRLTDADPLLSSGPKPWEQDQPLKQQWGVVIPREMTFRTEAHRMWYIHDQRRKMAVEKREAKAKEEALAGHGPEASAGHGQEALAGDDHQASASEPEKALEVEVERPVTGPADSDEPEKRSRLCHNCKQPGHIAKLCPADPTFMAMAPCYSCGELGHFAKSCPSIASSSAVQEPTEAARSSVIGESCRSLTRRAVFDHDSLLSRGGSA